jgi:hypothetical protein
MLSDAGLLTFSSTEPPDTATAGVMVNSTGSGPLVRLTVDVEMPQPWRPSATHIGAAMGQKALRND